MNENRRFYRNLYQSQIDKKLVEIRRKASIGSLKQSVTQNARGLRPKLSVKCLQNGRSAVVRLPNESAFDAVSPTKRDTLRNSAVRSARRQSFSFRGPKKVCALSKTEECEPPNANNCRAKRVRTEIGDANRPKSFHCLGKSRITANLERRPSRLCSHLQNNLLKQFCRSNAPKSLSAFGLQNRNSPFQRDKRAFPAQPKGSLQRDKRTIFQKRKESAVSAIGTKIELPTASPEEWPNDANLPSELALKGREASALDIWLVDYVANSATKQSLAEDISESPHCGTHKPSVRGSLLDLTQQPNQNSANKNGSFHVRSKSVLRMSIGSSVFGGEDGVGASWIYTPNRILSALTNANDQNAQSRLVERIHAHTLSQGNVFPSSLELYKIVRIVGEGNFSRVYLAHSRLCGAEVAIKTYSKARLRGSAACERVFQEVRSLSALNHPRIVRLIEVFEDKNAIYIVQELGQRTLATAMRPPNRLSEAQLKPILFDVVEGLLHAHSHGIAHRDIKAENLLLGSDGRAKICDFGASLAVETPKDASSDELIGTPAYMAPEIIARECFDWFKADVWAIGVFAFAALFQDLPFKGNNFAELRANIQRNALTFPLTPKLSPTMQKVMVLALEKEPSKRAKLSEIFELLGGRQSEPKSERSKRFDDEIVDRIVEYGFDRIQVIDSLSDESIDHINALYRMLQNVSVKLNSPNIIS